MHERAVAVKLSLEMEGRDALEVLSICSSEQDERLPRGRVLDRRGPGAPTSTRSGRFGGFRSGREREASAMLEGGVQCAKCVSVVMCVFM